MVTRMHARLFEDAARDLDRQLRARYLGPNFRAEYLKDFRASLDAIVETSHSGVVPAGRLLWMKRALQRVLRPYARHQDTVNQLMVERLAELHEELAGLKAGLDDLRADLTDDAERRDDALRAELGRAIRRPGHAARGRTPAADPADAPSPPVGAGARLVLGRLPARRPGYIHIDPDFGGGADLCRPLDDLPVTPGTVAEVVVANALEHYPAADVRERLLPYWASLLRPGGRLTIIADDVEAAAERLRDGQIDADEFADLLLGEGGRARRSAYSPRRLAQYVAEAGLTDVAVTDRRQRPDAGAYGFELAAVRPAA